MDTDLFNYEYPEDLVAQRPLPARHESRMMVVERAGEKAEHRAINDLPCFIKHGDLLVLNDSKVVPARLFGKRCTGEELEILIVEQRKDGLWRCLLKNAKRIRAGEKIFFGMQATSTACGREGIYLLMEFAKDSLALAIEHHGVPPLPPYIKREGYEAYTEEDRERYQTVYARKPGSAAAPTAGLHLSEPLIERVKAAGAQIASVTLHVGIDTFAPMRAERLGDHRMHGERIEISEDAANLIALAKAEGRRVIAIGTTTTRAIESAAAFEVKESAGHISWPNGRIHHGSWTSDLFITPGYDFRIADAMLTNFHQPRSTLLALVCAFAGREFILSCYREAIKERYRLFSYGDCMLII